MATLKDYYGQALQDAVSAHDDLILNRLKQRIAIQQAVKSGQVHSLADLLDEQHGGFSEQIAVAQKTTVTCAIAANGTETIGAQGNASGGLTGVFQITVGGSYQHQTGESDSIQIVTDLEFQHTDGYLSNLAKALGNLPLLAPITAGQAPGTPPPVPVVK